MKARLTLEIKRIRITLQRIEYVFRAARNIDKSVQEAQRIVKNAPKLFKEAANDLNLVIKEKPKKLRDFAKKTFDSKFLKKELIDKGEIPAFMPFVSTGCTLDSKEPAFSVLEKKWDDALILRRLESLGKGFVNIGKRAEVLRDQAVNELPNQQNS